MSRKSGNDDELSRASEAMGNREGRCCIDGARGEAGGRTACFLRSLGSRGRDDEALTERPSSGSECCWATLFSLDLDDPPVTVLLLPTLAVCTLSEMISSTGLGFRACAMASGPAWIGRKGAAMLARTRLESTVTGSTFSLIFSRRWGSAEPKTMRWTRLYILRHVLNAIELGALARSWR